MEVKSIKAILAALEELVRALKDEAKGGDGPDEKWSATIQTLNANPDEGPAAQLKTLLEHIRSVVEKETRTMTNKLMWPLKKESVTE